MDKIGRIIGFEREGQGMRQFRELHAKNWQSSSIPYDDRVRIDKES